MANTTNPSPSPPSVKGLPKRPILSVILSGTLTLLASCSQFTGEPRTGTINQRSTADTLSEQESIALAVLLYSSRNPSYLGDNGHFSLYLMLGDQDPSPEFLRTLTGTGWKVFPHSQYRGQPGEMEVAVGRFVLTGPDSAKGSLGAMCGPRCAGGDFYELKRSRGVWTVESQRPLGV
jgi:hypothetical protein